MPRRDPDARRGALGALVANLTPVDTREESPRELPIGSLTPSRFQPRRHFDEAALRDLAASVRERGVLQPLLVRPAPQGYEIVAGERRWRAAGLAGLATVPVVVRDLSDDEAQDAAAVENLQRADLNVIDEVDLIVALASRVLGLPAGEVPTRLHVLVNRPGEYPEDVVRVEALFTGLGRGAWTSFVKNKLRVLRWPGPVLTAMREHGLGYSLAGVVAAAPGERQAELLDLALGGATKAQLRERLLSFRKDKPQDPATLVAHALRDRRRLDALGAKERRRAETLIGELARLLGESN
ncbi:ParB/RepB/Spo0J family partition protein [Deinococcus aestuarii]|uniref:ParB/RepB/Spo0J family partition protein n=1 Tax=Deinococcus aestuarii TaxID=2774531 RepID=UPI001C0E054A|nr:ParB/RepB/Spo0J family partition protein [Deinococcus aestuarii]